MTRLPVNAYNAYKVRQCHRTRETAMKEDVPTQREEIILMMLISGEKYGREIRDEYERRSGRQMPYGSLYTTLDRMEDKGYLTARLGDPNPERGGNRRKFYRITGVGLMALNELRQMMELSEGGVAHAN